MSNRVHHIARLLLTTAAVLVASCASPTTDPSIGASPTPRDTAQPFPIARSTSDVASPTSYKGLALQLTDNGAPVVTAVDGVVGMVCVGMSNASQECADFITRLRSEYASVVSPAVRVVNCAVGSHAIERWIDAQYDSVLWDDCIARKLPAAGVRLDQVRVLFHKAANQNTTAANGAPLPTYPAAGSDYENFGRNLTSFSVRVKSAFPAVQAVYTSSRSYGGFAGSSARGEPLSYEEGHALNGWLRDHATVQGVWYGWGPYLWAPRCDTGVRNMGGTCYDRADYVADGVHPSTSGTAKVSAMLHARLLREAWYRR